MKKFLIAILFAACCFAPAYAQRPAPRGGVDNFDMRSGVQVALPPTIETPFSVAKVTNTAKKISRRATSTAKAAANIAQKSLIKPTAYFMPNLKMAMPFRVESTAQALSSFTTGDVKVDKFIVESGARNGVDPLLLYSIMHQESSFKPRAVSNKGASGLMQLMPGTALRFGVRDRFNPQQSVEGGARYVRFLLDFFNGDVALALAGYNAGEGAVLRYGRSVPPYRETREYVRRISTRYNLIRNPQTARVATIATQTQIARVQAETPVPLPLYEQHVFAVRLPDGKLRLVSQ